MVTAGIGENAPRIRDLICQSAGWLGARLDADLNYSGETSIGAAQSRVEILVIPADEGRAVSEGVLACIDRRPGAPPFVAEKSGRSG